MKKYFFAALALLFAERSASQIKQPADFGYRHLQCTYKGSTVDILVKSKKGEEQKKKPLFLFVQGSLPVPLLIRFQAGGPLEPFPFNGDSLLNDYHLLVISKPGVPVITDSASVQKDFTFIDPATGRFPSAYVQHNLLDYYVQRDIAVIRFLQAQPWVLTSALVVAGHSEGSTIAAKLTSMSKKVTRLIYASGNPLGRMMTIVAKSRRTETDSSQLAEKDFNYWKMVVADPESMNAVTGDPNKTTFDFSAAPLDYLKNIKIPVLVVYGTSDYSSYSNDFLRLEITRQKKDNFTFKAYPGLEHNFFPLKKDGQPDYDVFNWNKIATDWWQWLKKNQ